MAIKVNYSPNPEIARLQRKFNQESEMLCLARMDEDKEYEAIHRQRMEEFREQLSRAYANRS